MKTKEKKELHTKTENELLKMLKDAGESLVLLKLDKVQNKLKNTSVLSNTRQKIAIIKTVLREKELIKDA